MFHVPEIHRLSPGSSSAEKMRLIPQMLSTKECGNNGAFLIPHPNNGKPIFVIASDGAGWEHVSASIRGRIPTWEEMCYLKDMFWDEEDCAIQYHPPKSEYVNNHAYCLHLWRPTDQLLPMPDSILVGIKGLQL